VCEQEQHQRNRGDRHDDLQRDAAPDTGSGVYRHSRNGR
jgi:hypothetical protein